MNKSFLFKSSKCYRGVVAPFSNNKEEGPGISQR
jgi:hypothetical protein